MLKLKLLLMMRLEIYKYIYVEDATGGIRININKLNLYQDYRFKVGKNLL
jgi:hypothetical protein